jgi:hypothetical protein
MKYQTLRRRLCTAVVALAACAALAAPAAAEPGNDYPQPVQIKSGDTPVDFPGVSGTRDVETIPTPANVTESNGFDWPSAAIGAGGAGLLILLSVGGVALVSRRHVRVVR